MKLNRLPDFRIWSFTAFTYLFLITLIGVYLRLVFISNIGGLTFAHLLHSHSHTAMLGWVYSAIYIGIVSVVLTAQSVNYKKYSIIFWFTQFTVICMLFSFAVKGYSPVSIIFSTLHILSSYIFIIYFIRDTRTDYFLQIRNKVSYKFIRASLIFLVIATLAPWFLGLLASKGLSGSEIYTQTIYFYLHFLYNGFFTFALLGLWIEEIENRDKYSEKKTKIGYVLLFYSTITAYSISLLGFNLNSVIRFIAIASAVLQLVALIFLYQGCYRGIKSLIYNSAEQKILFWVFIISFVLKLQLQLLSTLSLSGNIAFQTREIPIGYIHLVMLGFISCGLLLWLGNRGYFMFTNTISKTGIIIFVLGFLLNEFLLFAVSVIFWFRVQTIPKYHLLLFISSAVMLAGISLMWLDNFFMLRRYRKEVMAQQ